MNMNSRGSIEQYRDVELGYVSADRSGGKFWRQVNRPSSQVPTSVGCVIVTFSTVVELTK